eukprot:Em0007g1051a
MQHLLDRCSDFTEWAHLMFNTKKCASLFMVNCVSPIFVDLLFTPLHRGDAIPALTWDRRYKYLGCPTGAHHHNDLSDLGSLCATLVKDSTTVFESPLAEWQKHDAFRRFLFPRVSLVLKTNGILPSGLLHYTSWQRPCPKGLNILNPPTLNTWRCSLTPPRADEGRAGDLYSIWSSVRKSIVLSDTSIAITTDSAQLSTPSRHVQWHHRKLASIAAGEARLDLLPIRTVQARCRKPIPSTMCSRVRHITKLDRVIRAVGAKYKEQPLPGTVGDNRPDLTIISPEHTTVIYLDVSCPFEGLNCIPFSRGPSNFPSASTSSGPTVLDMYTSTPARTSVPKARAQLPRTQLHFTETESHQTPSIQALSIQSSSPSIQTPSSSPLAANQPEPAHHQTLPQPLPPVRQNTARRQFSLNSHGNIAVNKMDKRDILRACDIDVAEEMLKDCCALLPELYAILSNFQKQHTVLQSQYNEMKIKLEEVLNAQRLIEEYLKELMYHFNNPMRFPTPLPLNHGTVQSFGTIPHGLSPGVLQSTGLNCISFFQGPSNFPSASTSSGPTVLDMYTSTPARTSVPKARAQLPRTQLHFTKTEPLQMPSVQALSIRASSLSIQAWSPSIQASSPSIRHHLHHLQQLTSQTSSSPNTTTVTTTYEVLLLNAQYRVLSKASTLEVKLVLVRCTVAGSREFPGLPHKEMQELKGVMLRQFPQLWQMPVQFELTWKDCCESIGQAWSEGMGLLPFLLPFEGSKGMDASSPLKGPRVYMPPPF